jgi:hypothetical protein
MFMRVLVTAGLTMPKVGKGQLVSYSDAMPAGASSLPSLSKQTVTILYVPSLFMPIRPWEGSAGDSVVEGEEYEDGEEKHLAGTVGRRRP